MQTKNGEWWDYSWNVAPGCTKVSPECDNCWALAMAKRLQGMNKPGYEKLVNDKGQWTGRVNLLEDKLDAPFRLKRPRVIAVNLMGDLFHSKVPADFIRRTFVTMANADWHTYMVLTKRPERMVELSKQMGAVPLSNVLIGTTAGTQESADKRWSSMAWLSQRGWNTWVSSEPRLCAINWNGWSFLKLMVTGGESGPRARPMYPAWPRADRDWCQENGVPFWFKQWGEWAPARVLPDYMVKSAVKILGGTPVTQENGEFVFRVGRKEAGRVLDGRVWNGKIGDEQ